MAHEMTNLDALVTATEENAVTGRAWHSKDTELSQSITTDDLIQRVAAYSVVAEPLVRQSNQAPVQGAYGVWADWDSGKSVYLTSAKEGRKFIQPDQFIRVLRGIFDDAGLKLSACGTYRSGGVLHITSQIPDSERVLRDGDTLIARLGGAIGYDGSLPFCVFPSSERMVCANTVRLSVENAKGKYSDRLVEYRALSEITPEIEEEIRSKLSVVRKLHSDFGDNAERFSELPLPFGSMNALRYAAALGDSKVLDSVILESDNDAPLLSRVLDMTAWERVSYKNLKTEGKSILAAMVEGPGSQLRTAKDTIWGGLNGVTYYVDHLRSREAKDDESRLSHEESALLGTGADLKANAYTLAAVLANTIERGIM